MKRLTRREFAWLSGSACMMAAGRLPGDEPVKRLVNRDIAQALTKAELEMLFAGKTAEQAKRWQAAFRKQLEKLLGPSTPPRNWSVKQLDRTELNDHSRLDLLLESKGIPSLPLYLLLPKGKDRAPAPAASLSPFATGWRSPTCGISKS